MEKEWLKLLEENQNIYIYGAGNIGKQILRLISLRNYQSKVKGFLVTDKAGNPDHIQNIPVYQIGELENRDDLVLIAVSESYDEEIFGLLEEYGYINIVCAYNFSFLNADDNTDGAPDAKIIDVRELFFKQYMDGKFNRFDIIVKVLAAENYYQMNEYGFELYKKMQEARIREGYSDISVKRFKTLIQSFEQRGYDSASEIIVDSNLRLINGAHRLALAVYYKTPDVKIRVNRSIRDIKFDMEWFQQYFCAEECKILEEKLEVIIADLNL